MTGQSSLGERIQSLHVKDKRECLELWELLKYHDSKMSCERLDITPPASGRQYPEVDIQQIISTGVIRGDSPRLHRTQVPESKSENHVHRRAEAKFTMWLYEIDNSVMLHVRNSWFFDF